MIAHLTGLLTFSGYTEVKTSLIIPCYWADDDLISMTKKCLVSLHGCNIDEVIVVDDGSPLSYEPHYGIFCQRYENGGYAAAVNSGLSLSQGDILILGNNDLVFTKGWLQGLLSVLEEGFDIATCWTGDQDYELEPVIKEGGKFGSLFAMTREVYETVGGFDEQFKGYFSDLDYRRRVLDAGFRIGMNCNLVVEHKAKATYERTDPDDNEYLRSMRLYEAKHGVVE